MEKQCISHSQSSFFIPSDWPKADKLMGTTRGVALRDVIGLYSPTDPNHRDGGNVSPANLLIPGRAWVKFLSVVVLVVNVYSFVSA